MLELAGPVVATELGLVTMGVVDTLVVGRIGPVAIGAVGLGNVLLITVAIFGMGLLLGLDTVVSQAFGAGRREDCVRWMVHGVLVALLAAPPLLVMMWIGIRLLPGWGIDPEVLVLVVPYLEVSSWGIVPLLLFASFRRYLQAMGIVRPIALIIVAGNILNLLLAMALVFGDFGFPALGAVGSGWATLSVRIALAIALLLLTILHARGNHYSFGLQEGFELWRIRRLVRLGLPAAVQGALEVGVFAFATALVGTLDAASLAAHQIVMNVATMTFIVPLGTGAAAAVLVGQAVGRENPHEARRQGWTAIFLGVGFMACAAITFITAGRLIVAAFTPDPAVGDIGVKLLLVAAVFQLFDGLQAVSTGALRGLGDTRTAMLANLAGHWLIGLPTGALLCFFAQAGVGGLWTGLSVGLIATGTVLCGAWARRSAMNLSLNRSPSAPHRFAP
ncbi:MAG: MATE family efflux transporter [Chloroflexi bacterium]|nr:MATE family efflux transporter [Chloroflexota bacterium]